MPRNPIALGIPKGWPLLDQFLTLFVPLVWPLATLSITLIFRRDLSQALGRVGKVKYRDLELTFRDDLHEAEQLASSIPTLARPPVVLEAALDEAKPLSGRLIVPPSPTDGSPDRQGLPNDLAESRPREAVRAAWGLVARASRFNRVKASTQPDLDALIGLLRKLRDRAERADQRPPTPEEARRFVDLARRVASRIDELG